jgi:diguanylate cyclase (GGDEF)-like protein
MTKPLRLLLIEDSERDAARLAMELRRGGYAPEITRVETEARLRAALADGAFDLVISDYCLPTFSAPDALRVFRENDIDIPFIVVSGAVGEEIAVEMMRAGAHDYVLKEKLTRLVPAVGRELAEAEHRSARRQAETLFQTILRSSPNPSAIIDADSGRIVHLSDSFRTRLLGGRAPKPDDTLFTIIDFSAPERLSGLLARGGGTALYSVFTLDGQKRVANVRVVTVEHQGTTYANVIIEDITEQHYLKEAFDAVSDAVLIVGSSDSLLYANRAAEELLGTLYFGMNMRPMLAMMGMADRGALPEPRIRIGDESYDVRAVPFRFAGETESSTILTFRNMSRQEELLEASTHDALTGLYNVRFFNEALLGASSASLALLDLDHFKPINDELGHAAGDEALIQFTALIRSVIRPSDVFARLGGDEFAILFPDTSLEDARRIVTRVYDTLATSPFAYEGNERRLSASCGLGALHPGESPEDARRRIDEALYAAKRGGRGQFVVT